MKSLRNNSIFPNGLQTTPDGYSFFYPLGTNKIDIPSSSSDWPSGSKLISPFVYNENNHIVGFCDTKAMTGSANIYLPYSLIDADFSSIDRNSLSVHAPHAVIKNAVFSDGSNGSIPEADFKFKGCKTVDDVLKIDPSYRSYGRWIEPLWDLESGDGMFYNTNLESFSSDLFNLSDGRHMFFYNSGLKSFNGVLSNLIDGSYMFAHCNLLSSFASDLSSLENGEMMFWCCSLDDSSLQNIASTIRDVNGLEGNHHIDIGLAASVNEKDSIELITSKGWSVGVEKR